MKPAILELYVVYMELQSRARRGLDDLEAFAMATRKLHEHFSASCGYDEDNRVSIVGLLGTAELIEAAIPKLRDDLIKQRELASAHIKDERKEA